MEVEGGNGIQAGVGAVTAESTLGWQTQPLKPKPLDLDLEAVLYSQHQLV